MSGSMNAEEKGLEGVVADLLEAVVPFDVLLYRRKQINFLNNLGKSSEMKPKPKVVQDAGTALASLVVCEEALERELLISISCVPGMEVTLSSRLKSWYSIYSKMLASIYDARALRVVVGDNNGTLHGPAVECCYSLLDIVHRLWTPIDGEFDDYIVNPKPSGYQYKFRFEHRFRLALKETGNDFFHKHSDESEFEKSSYLPGDLDDPNSMDYDSFQKYSSLKQDQFERLLPTFIQVIDLTEHEESEYWTIMSAVFEGRPIESIESRPNLDFVAPNSIEASINLKVRLLRAMFQWEDQLRSESSFRTQDGGTRYSPISISHSLRRNPSPSPKISVPIAGEIPHNHSQSKIPHNHSEMENQPPRKFFSASLTLRNKVSLATTIASKLSPAQRKLFEETCFGPWLRVQHPGGDASLTHLWLQTMTSDLPDSIQRGEEEIWFHFPPAQRGQTTYSSGANIMVEDLNAWNLFPWGSYIWKATWTKLSSAFDDRKNLDIRGFPQHADICIKSSDDIPRAISWKRKPSTSSTSRAITSPRAITDRPDYTPLTSHHLSRHHRVSSPPSPYDRRPTKMPRLLSPCSPPPRDESRELRDEVNALREEIGTLRDNDGAWRVEVSTYVRTDKVDALRRVFLARQSSRIRRRARAIKSPYTPIVRRHRKKKPDSPIIPQESTPIVEEAPIIPRESPPTVQEATVIVEEVPTIQEPDSHGVICRILEKPSDVPDMMDSSWLSYELPASTIPGCFTDICKLNDDIYLLLDRPWWGVLLGVEDNGYFDGGMFIPILERNHWLLVELQIPSLKAIVYDIMINYISLADLRDIIKGWSSYLAKYLDAINYWTRSGNKKPKKLNITVSRDETAPQQTKLLRGDCGPLVCLALDRLITGSIKYLPPTDIDRAAVGLWFRNYMARSIYTRRFLPASAL
ncbi:Guanosine-3',5'-bis(Diphosphate) 3'-pyrophosphohydrolase isoform 3 [Hibiscus syriacus]|uniref:Guanosine-3',5'-bis(Diphosphate) 3'-pyrophosphohydrolase isoform 3 n=1 Tax=Hibiscus syriacus TaxID=106335 RepID=A0A6A2YJD5_HIBSY|nr:Guanosine-3',5'-bis(Diphosphate) 3'-pyrophosphohydrolase isoform 3 [Hibiscus syriacus]